MAQGYNRTFVLLLSRSNCRLGADLILHVITFSCRGEMGSGIFGSLTAEELNKL
jgi:hypothetical protein